MKALLTSLILCLVLTDALSQGTAEERFWGEFNNYESRIYDFDKDPDRISHDISRMLFEYRRDLDFEISEIHEGKREFIVSAGGRKELVSSVIALVNSAPIFQKIEIVAFRQRMPDYQNMRQIYAFKDFTISGIWLGLKKEGNNIDITFFHPKYSEKYQDEFAVGVNRLLYAAIGEYDFITRVGNIEHKRLPGHPQEYGLIPFSELRRVFDEYKTNSANK